MKGWLFHLAVLGVLAVLAVILPAYHANNLARVLVLAVFATGYNLAFGYTGMLSLGHALFFGAGMFGAALPVTLWGWGGLPVLGTGMLAGGVVAAAVGVLALRTKGVSFMIVTLMFAQAGYLTLIYCNAVTGGDQGLVLPGAARQVLGLDLTQDGSRLWLALGIYAAALAGALGLVGSRFGRVMLAMRENEERSRMLGYDPYTVKLKVLVISGLYAGLAGAAYGVFFGYAGAGFATVQYSILPMLYSLLGGAGTALGPLIGAAVMFWLIDFASGLTNAYLMLVGVVLIVVVLFAPRGILGYVRERWLPWLP
ncbi:branched-chain amino acid ABC transporter permease [Fuscibacter oryzae]|uniref:Branched-chain amino acid ABC transporter permease n=1 Tax=Fuscibacter oryzae TaxID=2803939 RepID=A0A8J7SW06_9RHOB|nr:branched-chain amino acid ABC transporter permease [Fuscibacter oryzae]MBL4929191.1 branched-chain amino acid ABC transporter permease [Fuscibacter oryzae]